MLRSRSSIAALVLVVALVAAACDGSGDGSSSTTTTGGASTTSVTVSETTTTVTPLTSVPGDAVPGTNSPSIPDDVARQMREEIGALMLDVEESRALPFLSLPTVTILDDAEFTARVNESLQEDLDPDEVAADDALLTLLGLLEPDDDLYGMLVGLYTEQVAGFYDPDTAEMVVPVSVDGITPYQKVTIFHELVHALTEQHFDFNEEYERRVEEGNGDDASGILALVEGDATYQQFLYLESLPPADAVKVALEALSFDTSLLDAAPLWMQKDLGFPYERGLGLVTQIVATGGLKGVDEAYQDPPVSSEQVLDPNKYLRSEMPSVITPLSVDLGGWEMADEATFGEWGIGLVMGETLRPGMATQAAAGWGNDTYRLFIRGDDTAFAWHYVGETESDAEDLANGLIAHARDTMGAGASQESGGGLLFVGPPYVFIDRVGNEIFFVAATDGAAGADLRDQLGL